MQPDGDQGDVVLARAARQLGEQHVAQVVQVPAGVPGEGAAQVVQARAQRPVPALDQAVGVEQDRVAVPEDGLVVDPLPAGVEAEQQAGPVLVERADRPVGADDHRRRVPRAGPAQPGAADGALLGRLLDARDHERRQRGDPQGAHGGVEQRQDVGRAVPGDDRDPAEHRPELRHERGGLHVVADHVADHQYRAAVVLHERVVPVAADPGGLRGGLVPDHDLHVVGLDGRREQGALEGRRDVALPPVEPRVVEGQRRRGGHLDHRRDLVRGQRRSARPVEQGDGAEGAAAALERGDGQRRRRKPLDQVPGGSGGEDAVQRLDGGVVHVHHLA